MRFKSVILFFVFSVTFSYSQKQPDPLGELREQVNHYMSAQKPDSCYIFISEFLSRPGLDTVQRFYGQLYLGRTYFEIKKVDEGFAEIRKSLRLLCSGNLYKRYAFRAMEAMADEYFTLQQFDSSTYYAGKALQMVLREKPKMYQVNAARCYNMLGYSNYLNGHYKEALVYYKQSVDNYIAMDDICEVPLAYCKMAKVYNRTGDKSKAYAFLKRAYTISDSCQADENTLNCKYTELDILKENKEFIKALTCLEEINRMVEVIEDKKEIDRIEELEIKYRSKFQDQENNNLKALNAQKEDLLLKQKQALYVVALALILMAVLAFFLVRVSGIRKKAMAELHSQQEEIENKNKELERLQTLHQKVISVISHDLREPMLSLQLLVHAFHNNNHDREQLSRYANDVHSQLLYATQLLENLLNWSRTEISGQQTDTFSANPAAIAREIVGQFSSSIEKKHITIHQQIPESLLIDLPPDVLRIVLRNLLSNAIKYSYKNSAIYLLYNEASRSIVVKDHGTGIGDEKLRHLFSKDIETSLGTSHETGFGIGLYITHELLHRFGGSIHALKNPEGGMSFEISVFPLAL